MPSELETMINTAIKETQNPQLPADSDFQR